MKKFHPHLFLVFLALSCLFAQTAEAVETIVHSTAPEMLTLEARLVDMGFVDVQTLAPDIRVALKYASGDNFMRAAVYGDFKKAYLRKDAATKLALANRYLKEIRPDLTLLVGDALRPRSISQKMWSFLSGTQMQRYVANPRGGSMHNYGCAVDITICDIRGKQLDMGTPLDHFGELSQPRYEKKFLREGRLTKEQVENRQLLRKVMRQAGFNDIQLEWWHFEAFDKKLIRKTYSIVE